MLDDDTLARKISAHLSHRPEVTAHVASQLGHARARAFMRVGAPRRVWAVLMQWPSLRTGAGIALVMLSMKPALFLAALALACNLAGAAETSGKPAAPRAPATPTADVKLKDVTAVTSSGSGQAGYIHYFLITHPDESLDYHVGIELEDQRIASSFPNAGVIVSEFIKNGAFNANGKTFQVEHLYGIRPFTSDAEMRVLQKELTQRVAQWVDDETPYCWNRKPGERFCLSCGDFVVRILYPGANPLIPALPRDFSGGPGRVQSTNDLLLYLVGVSNLPDKRSKLARLAALDLPASMREDIIAMIEDDEPQAPAAIALPTIPATASPVAKNPPTKPTGSTIASRRPQSKKL